jgi:GNAT superfamily N-acetyltransferase
MKILTYRDLKSKGGLVPLLDHAFGWVFDQHQFEDSVKIDPRLKNGPVGFCAVENEMVVGHVGVMDLATRSLNGTVENVGGLYGVATLPGHTRRGVCTALMNSAHDYFREKNYRFSFLNTSPANIAHSLYEKLGYTDLIEYPSAYRVLKNKKTTSSKKETAGKLDLDKILKIYDEFSTGRTGFVVRDKAYLRMLRKVEEITPKQCTIEDKGYVIFKEEKSAIRIRELIALSVEEMHRLVGLMEGKTKGLVYDRGILNRALLDVYRSRGYMIQKRGFSVLMLKTLEANASFEQTYSDKFYLSRLDVF